MELSKAIISGSASAAKLALDLLSLPRLISLAPPFTVYLETEGLRQHGEAKVAENVIISNIGEAGLANKAYIADNVAPGPWTWHLDGYIPGNQLMEPSNLFTPIVRMNVNLIRNAFKMGSILTYKDGDNHIYKNVVIQSLDLDNKPDVKNKQPFAMVLKEINILSSVFGTLVENAAEVAEGSAEGEATNAGSVVAKLDSRYTEIAFGAAYGTAATASIPQNQD